MKTMKYLNRLNLYLKFSLLIFFVFFVGILPARAFGISPAKILLTIDPGVSQTVVVKITNDEKTDLKFGLGVWGMEQDQQGNPVFTRGEDVAETWVYPENNLVTIKSGQTKDVNFIIKIPIDAWAGSYYLGLFAEPVWPKGEQGSINTRLVSMLTLQVSGLVNESLLIENWAPQKNTYSEKKWKFDLLLKNSGSIETEMRGTLALRNWKGEEIFSQPLVLGNKLLAGAKRALQPEMVLRDDIKLPGLYQAQIKINYGRTNLSAGALAYVWYFPVWSRAILAGVGLVLVCLLVLMVKKAIKKD